MKLKLWCCGSVLLISAAECGAKTTLIITANCIKKRALIIITSLAFAAAIIYFAIELAGTKYLIPGC